LARKLSVGVIVSRAVLGMGVAALAKGTSSEAARSRILEITAQIGVLAKDIHRISRQLHPAILDDLGLGAALKNECAAFTEQHGIPTKFDPDNISRPFRTMLRSACTELPKNACGTWLNMQRHRE
jgi:signal transduction histidine kinase